MTTAAAASRDGQPWGSLGRDGQPWASLPAGHDVGFGEPRQPSPLAADLPRTPKCFREDSGFLLEGRWVDASGSFFSGSVIEITEESWCPLDVKEIAHRTATYSHKILSCRRAELFEQRANGSMKKFRATVGPNKTLLVEMPLNNLQWTLVRDPPGIVGPVGLRLSFDDAEDELRHTEEANQRNRLPTLAMSALILAAAIGEVVRRGRTTTVDCFCVIAAMAVGLGAWRLDLVYGDTLTIAGAAFTSVLLEVFQEEDKAIEHDLTEDGITLLLCTLLTIMTHFSGLEVRTRWSWLVPTVQVVCFIGMGLFYSKSHHSVLTDIRQVYCAILMATVGMLCWVHRWHHEREERRSWAQQIMMEKRTMEQERAHDRIKSVMEAQAQLEELSKASPKRRMVRVASADGMGMGHTEKTKWSPSMQMLKFRSEPPGSWAAPGGSRSWNLGDSQALVPGRSQHPGSFGGVPTPGEGVRSQGLSLAVRSRTSSQEQRTLQVPLPQQLQLNKISAENVPNKLLAAAMAGQTGCLAKVRAVAEQIRLPAYSLRQFFEDCVQAFPELGLFFVQDQETPASSGLSAEVEYQRTIGALFAVYWLLRLDVAGGDGKEGFCFGADAHWRTLRGSGEDALDYAGKSSSELTEPQKRQVFYQTMDWAKFREVVTDALSCPAGSEVDRITAMLTLTSFHDIMKVQDLCPAVQEQHAPYQGYEAGSLIFDHDIALAYVLEHHSWLLPSFHVLPREAQAAVLFSQAKMQFNHGWFVQAEAPPGAMLSGFKRVAGTAAQGDIAFYFLHWLTDLAGAEGTPLAGADKFAVKFPPKVLNAFLWSMRFLHQLQDSTETAVVEEYLRARWRTALPNEVVPSGPDAIALMRLATMSGTCGHTAVRAFRSLDVETMDNLSSEMALTGLADQRYQYPSPRSAGGPAFLVYYGPAVLQRCEDDHKHMRLALYALSAVYRAGRLLWPFRPDMKHMTVTLEIGQLKSLSIGRVFLGGAEESRKVWVLVRQSDKEASCKLLGPLEINSLMAKQIRFALLELEEEGEETNQPSSLDARNAGTDEEDEFEEDEEDEDDDAGEPPMTDAISYNAFTRSSVASSSGDVAEAANDLSAPLLQRSRISASSLGRPV